MNVQYECRCGASLSIDMDGLGSHEERETTAILTTAFIEAHRDHVPNPMEEQ